MGERGLMPTVNKYCKGQLKFSHLVDTNQWGDWNVTFYPDGNALEEIRDMQANGLKNILKKDENGYYITFKRAHRVERGDKTFVNTPPSVVASDGQTPVTDLIGSGSKVTVKLETYSHGTPGGGRAIAARLAGVQVDELVPYYGNVGEEELY
jgi:hypothetical protein